MLNNTETKQTPAEGANKIRKPYHTPRLKDLGDLRTLTLGGSPGVLDSGSAGIRKPPADVAPGFFDPSGGDGTGGFPTP